MFAVGEEAGDEIGLAFLERLDTERHCLERRYHLLCIAQRKVAQETLVITVNLVVDERLLARCIAAHILTETLNEFFEHRLVEDIALACHHIVYLVFCEQFACLERYTVGTGIEHIDPQLLVEELACEHEHLHLWMLFFHSRTDFHTHSCRATKTKVKEQ